MGFLAGMRKRTLPYRRPGVQFRYSPLIRSSSPYVCNACSPLNFPARTPCSFVAQRSRSGVAAQRSGRFRTGCVRRDEGVQLFPMAPQLVAADAAQQDGHRTPRHRAPRGRDRLPTLKTSASGFGTTRPSSARARRSRSKANSSSNSPSRARTAPSPTRHILKIAFALGCQIADCGAQRGRQLVMRVVGHGRSPRRARVAALARVDPPVRLAGSAVSVRRRSPDRRARRMARQNSVEPVPSTSPGRSMAYNAALMQAGGSTGSRPGARLAARRRAVLAGHRRRHLRVVARGRWVSLLACNRDGRLEGSLSGGLRGGRSPGEAHRRPARPTGCAVLPLRRDRRGGGAARSALRRPPGHRHRTPRRRRTHPSALRPPGGSAGRTRLRGAHRAAAGRRVLPPGRRAPRRTALRPRGRPPGADLRPAVPAVHHRHQHGGRLRRRDGAWRWATTWWSAIPVSSRWTTSPCPGCARSATCRTTPCAAMPDERPFRHRRPHPRSAHRRHGADGGAQDQGLLRRRHGFAAHLRPSAASGWRRWSSARHRFDRLRAPIGLPIGSKTPPEIAVAVLAEITAVRKLGATAAEAALERQAVAVVAASAAADCCRAVAPPAHRRTDPSRRRGAAGSAATSVCTPSTASPC